MAQQAGSAPIRVVTFGSDHPFTAPALGLLEGLDGFEHVGHVRTSDERRFLRRPNCEQARRFLADLRPDLFLSCGYGWILREETLAIATIGGVNVHPSLLPRFRGRDVVRWALYEGASEVGVTIHEMTLPVDTGPILAQKSIRVSQAGASSPGELYEQLARFVPELLGRVLAEIRRTGRIEGVPQPPGGSFRDFPRRQLERVEIDWSERADELVRRARVFPGEVNVRIGRRRLFFRRIEKVVRPPGTVVRRRLRTLDVVAGDQQVVRLVLRRPILAWGRMGLAALSSRSNDGRTAETEARAGTLVDDLLDSVSSIRRRSYQRMTGHR